jgi:hypothetical protein
LGALRRTHGRWNTPAYHNWFAMKARCTDPMNPAYQYYGGRGITVWPAWANSFETFLRDVGERPSGLHTLDRIDNSRGYEPGNVRWATRTTQMRNMRKNRWVTFRGETLCLSEWCTRLGIKRDTVNGRLDRCGWTVERAFTTPVGPYKRK